MIYALQKKMTKTTMTFPTMTATSRRITYLKGLRVSAASLGGEQLQTTGKPIMMATSRANEIET